MKAHIILSAALVVSGSLALQAQTAPSTTVQGQAGRGAKATLPVLRELFSMPIEGAVVKGAPYSAEVVSESIQTLGDGNRIVHRITGRVFRDRDGRVRREEDQAPGSKIVSITDPVAGTSFVLDPEGRIARATPNLKLFQLTRTLNEFQGRKRLGFGSLGQPVRDEYWYAFANTAGGAPVEEKLPERTIEGVVASGVRKTTTIAAGAIGNEQPIKIVSEEWTSSQLQVLVLTDLNDPRSGRSTYKLLKISRAEPDPALFKVPGGYTVEPLPPGARGGGRR